MAHFNRRIPKPSVSEIHSSMSDIENKYIQLGGPNSVLGHPTRDEMPCKDGVGRNRLYQHGSIFWHPDTGAHETHRGIYTRWAELEYERGRLGYPLSDERPVSDEELGELAALALDPNEEQKGNLIHLHWTDRAYAKRHSRCSDFQGGRIYWPSVSPNIAFIKVIYDEAGKRADVEPWEGVAGMRELKAMLERDVINPLKHPEKYKEYELSLPNGILLHGPPGCGKTLIARALAKMLGIEFIEVTPAMLGSIYCHGPQLMISNLFADALKRTPCLLFLDEIDAMVPRRIGNEFGHQDNEVNEFLVQLNECARRGILVVGATNRKENIDPAVLRPGRLDKKFFVGLPDDEARMEQVRMCMGNRPQEKIGWKTCATKLKGYTCAEIAHVVTEAARDALQQDRPISTEHILHSARNNPPTHADAVA